LFNVLLFFFLISFFLLSELQNPSCHSHDQDDASADELKRRQSDAEDEPVGQKGIENHDVPNKRDKAYVVQLSRSDLGAECEEVNEWQAQKYSSLAPRIAKNAEFACNHGLNRDNYYWCDESEERVTEHDDVPGNITHHSVEEVDESDEPCRSDCKSDPEHRLLTWTVRVGNVSSRG